MSVIGMMRSAARRRLLPLAIALALASCRDDATGPGSSAGPADPARSQVNASQTTVTSGATAVLTLLAMDAQGRTLSHGGSSVLFTAQGGSSTGVAGPTTDNGDGSYTAVFTGVIAGTATTMGATIDGANVTTPLPVIEVRPGAFSPDKSTLSISPRTVLPGGKATLEFIARDAVGNQLDKGGLTVSLQVSGGSAVGTIGEVTDHQNGRYTALFTAAQAGTPLTIEAIVEGSPISTSLPIVAVARGISLENSVLSVPYDTLSINSGLQITLQLRDSANVARTSGGDTVQFSMKSGVGGGEGALSDFADHDDGSYTVNFTGTQSGTVVLGVRINGRNKGDSLLQVIVEAIPITPQNSLVRVSKEVVTAGDTATLSADIRDFNGDATTEGDLVVSFFTSVDGEEVDGMSVGEIGPTRYDGNGVYSAIFTARRSGLPAMVGARVDDSDIQMLDSAGVSHLPTITVRAGSPSLDSTIVEAAPKRISMGDSATIRLTARDAFGNALSEGGLAVTFTRSGGTGVSVGRIGPVVDHDDGTYTAQYFGDSSGAPDAIRSAIEGLMVASPSPTITVGTECSAGPLSLSVSDLTINDNTKARFPVKVLTLPSGVTTTLTVRVTDQKGCAVMQPHQVALTTTGGSSTGVLGEIVNLGDGQYIATFRGHRSGTPTSLVAAIDGAPLTTLPVVVTVIPGDISPRTSVTFASASSVAPGDTVVLTLKAYDAAGNEIKAGGRSVEFVVEGSNAGGVIGPTNDARDGTYTARYVAIRGGVVDTIAAHIDGTPAWQRITVSISP